MVHAAHPPPPGRSRPCRPAPEGRPAGLRRHPVLRLPGRRRGAARSAGHRRPALPDPRQPRLRRHVVRRRPHLSRHQRQAAPGRHHHRRLGHRRPRPPQPGLHARHRAVREGRRGARAVRRCGRGPGRHPRRATAPGRLGADHRAAHQRPRARRGPKGRRRLGAHHRRPGHGEPGRCRPHGLPVQRPPVRQGHVHLPGHRAERLHRGGQRPARRHPARGRGDHLDLPHPAPHGHRAGPGLHRPLRRTAPRGPPRAAPARRGTQRRPRGPRTLARQDARPDRLDGEQGRPVPVRELRRDHGERHHRVRTGDTDPLPLREEAVHRARLPRLVRRVGHGARAVPPVVRRQRQPPHLVRRLAERGTRDLVRGAVRRGEGAPPDGRPDEGRLRRLRRLARLRRPARPAQAPGTRPEDQHLPAQRLRRRRPGPLRPAAGDRPPRLRAPGAALGPRPPRRQRLHRRLHRAGLRRRRPRPRRLPARLAVRREDPAHARPPGLEAGPEREGGAAPGPQMTARGRAGAPR
ncbi:hypothetical protein SGPA1_11237 [Streptomyces misionensis JCM 4497]